MNERVRYQKTNWRTPAVKLIIYDISLFNSRLREQKRERQRQTQTEKEGNEGRRDRKSDRQAELEKGGTGQGGE